ncbi:MAG: transporter substrate-binding domain-containing protein [Devosia sp.]|uniref:transporter substrate-binding domain-containing protein n=1 Tax=Devosia sp. TaxID=1871048 RepID=UPI001AD4CB65|nr:transporter substrate-binding domain-containing protein [Devosia sp.]MBN9310753.1 transporter substrate-binding domain-containing protein [Devosia sp.]MBN9315514.1 transporter substrate-binding domain-containing protein [Devosia sp.]
MPKFLLAAAALALLASTAAAAPVRLATEGAYAPYNFIDEASGKPAGFEIDLGNELCKRAGLECTWQTNDWDSIIPNLVAGNYDAIMAGMSITDERKQTIDFTQNYLPPDPSYYIVRSGTALDFAALSGKNIGVQGGTIQAGYVQETFGGSNTVKSYGTADQALADLNAGNLDVILADASYVNDVVAGSGGAVEKTGPEVKLGNGIGIGLRKSDEELKQKLNATIDEMKKDGSLDALIIKWFPDKAPGPIFAGG